MMTGLRVLAVLVLAVILRPLLAYQAPTRMSTTGSKAIRPVRKAMSCERTFALARLRRRRLADERTACVQLSARPRLMYLELIFPAGSTAQSPIRQWLS